MRLVILVGLLAATTARAEPEGHRGGKGRAPGTSYSSGGVTLTVRGASVEVVKSNSKWSCGGVEVTSTETVELVTVMLVVSNPTKQAVSAHLANMDLVIRPAGADPDDVSVEEGACVPDGQSAVTDVSLGARRRQTVPVKFLVPRRATPKILVYNDDDFPALFALPAAKRTRSQVH